MIQNDRYCTKGERQDVSPPISVRVEIVVA